MKKILAVTAGFLVAFVPAGTAVAGDGPKGTAWGNCTTSAAGGRADATPAPGGVENGRGFGGHAKVPCAVEAPEPPVDDEPTHVPPRGNLDDLR